MPAALRSHCVGPPVNQSIKGKKSLGWRMVDVSVTIYGSACNQCAIGKESLGDNGRNEFRHLPFDKKDFFVVYPALRIVLFLVGIPCQPLPQHTAAAAMHLDITPVLTKILGDIILVGVEIGDDHSLAEGRSHKGQQQYEGCALSKHALVEVSAKIRH